MTAGPELHVPGYQRRDREIVDYALTPHPGSGVPLRGPLPSLRPGRFFACLGAAQTFGCFCPCPYPDLLAERLGLPALNLGYGGAGPGFFLRHPALLRDAAKGRFAVLQVLSARSVSNRLFDAAGLELLTRRRDGVRLGADAAYRELLDPEPPPRLRRLVGDAVARRLVSRVARLLARRVVAETRRRWIEHHRRLVAALGIPTILFWFSPRSPDVRLGAGSLPDLFGGFPQMVDRKLLEAVRPLFAATVTCRSERGRPQPLVSRFTQEPTTVDPALDRPDLGGRTWTHNTYYPSPEMHEDAAAALEETCRRFL